MESKVPESFHELCARALKEHDVETVPEIVDRILRAIPESLKGNTEYSNRKQRSFENH